MTEQQAEVWKKRLKKIWQPQRVRRSLLDDSGDLNWDADMRQHIFLSVAIYADVNELPFFDLYCNWGKEFAATLFLDEEGQLDHFTATTKNAVMRDFIERFLMQWQPIFRRGCWLSGCDIEATAHEKAEWMQGFSREEIEAWNLKS